ncbi:MAG: peptidase [Candidatus Aminicenantes bacterium]|nr:MAG: peptidase [Candidatus Aminicenantes bacterium]
MRNNKFIYLILVFFLVLSLSLITGCGKKEEPQMTKPEEAKPAQKKDVPVIKDYENIETVKAQLAKLAPVKITYDASNLTGNEKKVLKLLVKAAKYMDRIFLIQVYRKNFRIKKELNRLKKENPDYKVLNAWFNVNFGPFDRLKAHKPFINLKEEKPKGANFYPGKMTKEEFEAHIKANPQDEEAFTSNFTVIRKQKDGKLVAVPYSKAYKKLLEPAAKLLKEAAQLAENPSLKKYLNSRAEAFLSNDYFQSDMDWMDLSNHKIEVVIGPYEVYEDRLFGYKAAFEAFITLVDHKESEKWAKVASLMNEMEKNLPIDDKHKNFNRGTSSPSIIAEEVFTGGDTKSGIQTTAFNLPNDEKVREAKGSKQVMLRNIARAKFQKCWIPIVKEVLAESELPLISFDAYFNHVMMHEYSHGLGPGIIEKNGKKTTVNKELKDHYSTIEEAKADVLGIWNSQFMVDKGVFPKELEKNIYASYLGGMFRSIRFGIDKAHGGANAIQMNYMLEKQAFLVDKQTGRFRVNPDKEKVKAAVKQLANELLVIQALGDYERAGQFIKKYKSISPELEQALEKVKHVPTDIRPIYAIEKELRKKK